MKKALIISYYWPPAGGPGSQRVVKFAKYLRSFNWQPVVLTLKNGEYPYIDPSLNDDIAADIQIYHTKSIEPFNLYKKTTNRQKDDSLPVGLITYKKTSYKEKTASWVRANLFVPDARIGWLPFAVVKGLSIIKKENINLIFTSSPPHSSQLIGMWLNKITGLPWVADLRDPWTNIRYYRNLKRATITKKIDAHYEYKTLNNANQITTVSKDLVREFQEILCQNTNKINVIPNGYDEENYQDLNYEKADKFQIIHTGNLLEHQNPLLLWKCLQLLFSDNDNIKNKMKILFFGTVHDSVKQAVKNYKLENNVEFSGFIPHKHVLKKIKNASILLMVVPNTINNNGIVTGKLFEYIGSGRPILVIGPPKGDAGEIISTFKQSIICDYGDIQNCCDFILNQFKLWQEDKIAESALSLRLPFSRKILTEKLAQIFNIASLK